MSGQRCYVNSPRIKSQPSSEPVLTRNTSASVFSPPSPLGKTGWLEWTGWSRVLPPSQAGSGDNTLQVRLWLIIVPWGQALLKTECSEVQFSMWSWLNLWCKTIGYKGPALSFGGVKSYSQICICFVSLTPCVVQGSAVFQNDFFSPSPAESTGGHFSYIYCENLLELLGVNLTKLCPLCSSAPFPQWLGTPGVFNSQTCLH